MPFLVGVERGLPLLVPNPSFDACFRAVCITLGRVKCPSLRVMNLDDRIFCKNISSGRQISNHYPYRNNPNRGN
jgi:hypothetical protein